MKGPLLLLIMLGYIAVAVYSLGKTGSNKVSLKPSYAPVAMSLDRVTLATHNMTAMVHFYNEVFGADLLPVPQDDLTTSAAYQGNLAGVSLLLSPGQSARVKAGQNRQQLRFAVSNLEAAVQVAQAAGGKAEGKSREQRGEKLIAIRDPDGNTLEFTQAIK